MSDKFAPPVIFQGASHVTCDIDSTKGESPRQVQLHGRVTSHTGPCVQKVPLWGLMLYGCHLRFFSNLLWTCVFMWSNETMEHASVTWSLNSKVSSPAACVWFGYWPLLPYPGASDPPLSPPYPCPGAWVLEQGRLGSGLHVPRPPHHCLWQVARGHMAVRASLSPPTRNLVSLYMFDKRPCIFTLYCASQIM